MKRFFALLMAVLMLLSLAACGKDADNNDTPSTNAGDQTIQNPDGYKAAVDRLVKCTIMGDAETLEKLAPEAFWLFHEKSGVSRSDLLSQAKYSAEAGHQYFQKHLGEHFTYAINNIVKEDVDAATLAAIAACMESQKGIPSNLVTAACKVTADVDLSGTLDIVHTLESVVFQIDGNWYCGSYYARDEGDYVSFEIEGMIGG